MRRCPVSPSRYPSTPTNPIFARARQEAAANLSNTLLQIASVTCCSLPPAELRQQVSLSQTATCRLDISESEKNSAGRVIQ